MLSGVLRAVLMLIFLTSCNSGSGLSIEEKIAEISSELELTASSDNLVVDIASNSDGTTSFSFENGISRVAAPDIIKNIFSDFETWRVTIDFVDDSSVTIGLVGEPVDFHLTNSGADETPNFPLVRRVTFTLPHQGRVRYRVQGTRGPLSDFEITSSILQPGEQSLSIKGLYLTSDSNVVVTYLSASEIVRSEDVLLISKPDREYRVPNYEVIESEASYKQRFFLHGHRSAGCRDQIYGVDQFGDIRWLAHTRSRYGLHQISTGDLIFVGPDLTNDEHKEFTIVSLDGEKSETYLLPEPYWNIHHDITEVSTTEFLLTVNDRRKDTIEDVVVLFDIESGEVTRAWDLEQHLPKTYKLIYDERDWFHMNAVDYDARDQSLILSGQRFGLVKLSWNDELIWMISDSERLSEFLSDDRYSSSIYRSLDGNYFTWGQHDVEVDEVSGEYYVFDNGLGRNYSNQTQFSRLVIFEVDEAAATFTTISEFGSEMTQYYAPIISGVDYTTQSVLLNFGSLGYHFNYVDNRNWVDQQTVRRTDVAFGAALVEYNRDDGSVITEATISCVDPSTTQDFGIYRIEYLDLAR